MYTIWYSTRLSCTGNVIVPSHSPPYLLLLRNKCEQHLRSSLGSMEPSIFFIGWWRKPSRTSNVSKCMSLFLTMSALPSCASKCVSFSIEFVVVDHLLLEWHCFIFINLSIMFDMLVVLKVPYCLHSLGGWLLVITNCLPWIIQLISYVRWGFWTLFGFLCLWKTVETS